MIVISLLLILFVEGFRLPEGSESAIFLYSVLWLTTKDQCYRPTGDKWHIVNTVQVCILRLTVFVQTLRRRRAKILCHAPRRRRIFCGLATFQPKMEILSASRIFFGAISALTEIESLCHFKVQTMLNLQTPCINVSFYVSFTAFTCSFPIACSRPLH